LRVPVGPASDRRVEHRVAGADSNIHLVLAAVLAGAHHGLKHELDPGPPITGNAYKTIPATLTSSWHAALAALEASETLTDYLGDDFLRVYLILKRAERERFQATITALEYAWYLSKV
jgi:glutamine synthetase